MLGAKGMEKEGFCGWVWPHLCQLCCSQEGKEPSFREAVGWVVQLPSTCQKENINGGSDKKQKEDGADVPFIKDAVSKLLVHPCWQEYYEGLLNEENPSCATLPSCEPAFHDLSEADVKAALLKMAPRKATGPDSHRRNDQIFERVWYVLGHESCT